MDKTSKQDTNRTGFQEREGNVYTAPSVDELKTAFHKTLPNANDNYISALTELIIGIANESISTEAATRRITTDERLLTLFNKLSGKEITTSHSVIRFGSNAQIGDVAIQDLAGGDINKIYINIGETRRPATINYENASVEDMIQLREAHQRRLTILERRVAVEGRRAEPADIVEVEDIKRVINSINDRIFRVRNGISGNEILFSYDEVQNTIELTMNTYKTRVLESFDKVLNDNNKELAAHYLNYNRKRVRRSMIFSFVFIGLVIPLSVVADYLGATDQLIRISLYTMTVFSLFIIPYGIYQLFIKRDYTGDDFTMHGLPSNNKVEDKSNEIE